MPRFLFITLFCLIGLNATATETVRVSAVTAPGTPWHDGWLHFEEALSEAEVHVRVLLKTALFPCGGVFTGSCTC